MSLLTNWRSLTESHPNQEAEVKFWEGYLKKEAEIYKEILNKKIEVVEGKLADLAASHDMTPEYFIGFLDGISESLKHEIILESYESDSIVKLEIDFEKLYYNMLKVEAEWLYNLKGWDNMLTEERRKEIQKEYKASKTVVKGDKIGRNDVCACGSGKKYKKCCGK